MQLSFFLPVALFAVLGSAATFMSSMEAVTEVAERNYIGGPAAIARAMAAGRHVGNNEHAAMRARHRAKMADWQNRDSEYVNMKYREFLASIAAPQHDQTPPKPQVLKAQPPKAQPPPKKASKGKREEAVENKQ